MKVNGSERKKERQGENIAINYGRPKGNVRIQIPVSIPALEFLLFLQVCIVQQSIDHSRRNTIYIYLYLNS